MARGEKAKTKPLPGPPPPRRTFGLEEREGIKESMTKTKPTPAPPFKKGGDDL
jgi:hypothetical protein